jgi:hypothetical protein
MGFSLDAESYKRSRQQRDGGKGRRRHMKCSKGCGRRQREQVSPLDHRRCRLRRNQQLAANMDTEESNNLHDAAFAFAAV